MTTEADRDAIGRVEKRLDDLFSLVGDVRDRLAFMEGQSTHSAVKALDDELTDAKKRITELEAAHNLRHGVTLATRTWAEWIHRLAPWGFALGLAAWNYFRFPH